MTKITRTETLEDDWLSALDDTSVAEAIAYLQTLPQDATLSINWHGYGSADGEIYITRQETDEEYTERLEYEAEVRREAVERANEKRLADQKNIDDMLAKLETQRQQLLKARPK